MDTRRDFIKKSFLLSGAAGLSGLLPASVQRALAIDPAPGSTYLDAEHVVILMQENRSFDHCFGMLRGVRGFNDPRAITLPDKRPVWLQTNEAGETYAPFRLNIKETNITWLGDLPHSRSSQVDAWNGGKYDKWLKAKTPRHKKMAAAPLTLGHYTREDLPFNYALADAFTICDQHFCSAMTSTTPNRLFLWTGTIREKQEASSRANIRNENMKHGMAKWETFPELLQQHGISWKVYQNDISCGGGFKGEERSWLANFGCNPLEFFARYNVKFSDRYVKSLQQQAGTLPAEISDLEAKAASAQGGEREKIQAALEKKRAVLANAKEELQQWSAANFEKLSAEEKELYRRAFVNNAGDPAYHEITTLSYRDGETERTLTAPKGDVLHQFREDVKSGKLPTVSWLAGPQNFSDHPSAPWYGAWYVSEILDILTHNPEVWKKTIFILTYDENDGYFDHVPPFVPPDPQKPGTGKCSPGIATDVEHIRREQELQDGVAKREAREGPVGLGYRVPLVIASPWSRGGQVCSQVFDHTSTLQFLERFLGRKFNKNIRVNNISSWRRAICGDLTAVFKPYNGEKPAQLPFLEREPFIETIHKAQFKKEPGDYRRLSAEDISKAMNGGGLQHIMAGQEPGVKPSCALPYQLYADAQLSSDGRHVEIKLEAANGIFGSQSAGAPFNVYAPGNYRAAGEPGGWEAARNWRYAVAAGHSVTDTWPVADFEDKRYHLRVYGPNGFYREYKGDAGDPQVNIACEYQRDKSGKQLTGNIALKVVNLQPGKEYDIEISDHAYGNKSIRKTLKGGGESNLVLDLQKSFGWYDFSVRIAGAAAFEKRYAGRVETGKAGFSDPAMGRSV